MRVWGYVITGDFGFAPNFDPPTATLATCKPKIRRKARLGDLIIAFNGSTLLAKEPHSVRWAGIVSEILDLAVYWHDPRFSIKKPTRYGGVSDRADNIYRPAPDGSLQQVENKSHGPQHAARDIGGKNALIFERFWYFGQSVAVLPAQFDLRMTGGRRGEQCSEIDEQAWGALEAWLAGNEPAFRVASEALPGKACSRTVEPLTTDRRRRC